MWLYWINWSLVIIKNRKNTFSTTEPCNRTTLLVVSWFTVLCFGYYLAYVVRILLRWIPSTDLLILPALTRSKQAFTGKKSWIFEVDSLCPHGSENKTNGEVQRVDMGSQWDLSMPSDAKDALKALWNCKSVSMGIRITHSTYRKKFVIE